MHTRARARAPRPRRKEAEEAKAKASIDPERLRAWSDDELEKLRKQEEKAAPPPESAEERFAREQAAAAKNGGGGGPGRGGAQAPDAEDARLARGSPRPRASRLSSERRANGSKRSYGD